jgi:hypothetical protein
MHLSLRPRSGGPVLTLAATLTIAGTGVGVAAGAVATTGTATAASTPAATRSLSYQGLRLQVPAGWPVVDLTAAPRTCVRFDVHAVYLGHPGADQQCPQAARGLVDALLLEPLDAASARTTPQPSVRVPAGGAVPAAVPATTGHVTTLALTDAGVMLTVAYAPDPTAVSRILATASVRPTGPRESAAAAAPGRRAATTGPGSVLATGGVPGAVSASAATSWVEVPGTFQGLGFDACTAPSSTTMDAWLAGSPYRALGVYIGGAARACQQPNLTADWVARQAAQGWHLVPLYVGLQAPCTTFSNRIDPANAPAQGSAAADDAADAAYALGMGQGSAITFDMEYYSRGGTCSTAVLQFLSAWTTQLHARGYRSSVYSSASAAIADLSDSYNNTAYARPDQIFTARWDGVASTAEALVPAEFWSAQQRMKQYRGGHDETYGGITINLDNDILDVAANSSIPLDATPPAVSFVSPAAGTKARGSVTVTANASDASGISRVELLVNGWLVATDQAPPYVLYWPTGRMFAPNTVLTLRAYDRRGNVALVQRSIMVDCIPPGVSLPGAPRDRAWVGRTVGLKMYAGDLGGMSRVELWINGRRVGVDPTSPYTFTIRTASYGHTLRVQLRAYDQTGNVTTVSRTWRR